MKKLLTVLSMAMAFVTVTAISAFCANAAGGVSGLSRQPLSEVQVPLRNQPVPVLAQAESNSGGTVRYAWNDTETLVSDGLLKPGSGAEDRQANDDSKSYKKDEDKDHREANNDGDFDKDKDRDKDKDHHEGRCKHGEHKKNKHCVPSSSE
jgi:hypothetical protein